MTSRNTTMETLRDPTSASADVNFSFATGNAALDETDSPLLMAAKQPPTFNDESSPPSLVLESCIHQHESSSSMMRNNNDPPPETGNCVRLRGLFSESRRVPASQVGDYSGLMPASGGGNRKSSQLTYPLRDLHDTPTSSGVSGTREGNFMRMKRGTSGAAVADGTDRRHSMMGSPDFTLLLDEKVGAKTTGGPRPVAAGVSAAVNVRQPKIDPDVPYRVIDRRASRDQNNSGSLFNPNRQTDISRERPGFSSQGSLRQAKKTTPLGGNPPMRTNTAGKEVSTETPLFSSDDNITRDSGGANSTNLRYSIALEKLLGDRGPTTGGNGSSSAISSPSTTDQSSSYHQNNGGLLNLESTIDTNISSCSSPTCMENGFIEFSGKPSSESSAPLVSLRGVGGHLCLHGSSTCSDTPVPSYPSDSTTVRDNYSSSGSCLGGAPTAKSDQPQSISRLSESGAHYASWEELQALPNEPNQATFQTILHRLKTASGNWLLQFSAETDMRRIALFHPQCLAQPVQSVYAKMTGVFPTFGASAISLLLVLADSPRSHVAKNTILALTDIFLFADKYIAEASSLEAALTLCLRKSSSTTGGNFIMEETEKALKQVILVGEEIRIMSTILRILKDTKPSSSFRLRTRCLASLGFLFLRLDSTEMQKVSSHKDFAPCVSFLVKGSSDGASECRHSSKISLLVLVNLVPDIETKVRNQLGEAEMGQLRNFVLTSGSQNSQETTAEAIEVYFDIRTLATSMARLRDLAVMSEGPLSTTEVGLKKILENLNKVVSGYIFETVKQSLQQKRAVTPLNPAMAQRMNERVSSVQSRMSPSYGTQSRPRSTNQGYSRTQGGSGGIGRDPSLQERASQGFSDRSALKFTPVPEEDTARQQGNNIRTPGESSLDFIRGYSPSTSSKTPLKNRATPDVQVTRTPLKCRAGEVPGTSITGRTTTGKTPLKEFPPPRTTTPQKLLPPRTSTN